MEQSTLLHLDVPTVGSPGFWAAGTEAAVAKDFPMITLRTDINPWERQEPRETELMYSRFLVFRDLGPETDRLRQCLEVLNTTGDKLTYQTIKDYSSAFRWSARAATWDRYTAQADRARMVRRRRKAIDDQCKAAEKLRSKALTALERLDVETLTASDIVKFVDLSHRIERSIYTEFAEAAPAAADAPRADIEDIQSWTPVERKRRMDMLRAEMIDRTSRAAQDDEVVA